MLSGDVMKRANWKIYAFWIGLAEAVDLDALQVIVFGQFGTLPEHRITGIEDGRYTDKFQCGCIPQDTEIIQMPVGICQDVIRQDLVL